MFYLGLYSEPCTYKVQAVCQSYGPSINIVKMFILSKAIYRFSSISIKTSMIFFTETKKNVSKTYMNHNTSSSQSNPEEDGQAENITILDFRIYHEASVNQTSWYWYENRHTDQQNTTESISKPMYSQTFIFNKGSKNITRKRKISSKYIVGKSFSGRRKKLGPCFLPNNKNQLEMDPRLEDSKPWNYWMVLMKTFFKI